MVGNRLKVSPGGQFVPDALCAPIDARDVNRDDSVAVGAKVGNRRCADAARGTGDEGNARFSEASLSHWSPPATRDRPVA